MKEGEESRTAVFVCLARAAAHERTRARGFSDPTAFAFLPAEAKASFVRFRAGATEASEQALHHIVRMRSEVIAARTIAVDEAVRGANAPQLVNLGAGLDGRAWRMKELSNAVVFEVDHAASQVAKRERATSLTPVAREIRFVPVDFASDSLALALTRAGHAAQTPTMWVWEGVVPYLTQAEVDATLAVVKDRSASGSRIAVMYQPPLLAIPVRSAAGKAFARYLWENETPRSWWTPQEMGALLEGAGFSSVVDRNLSDLATEYGADLSGAGPRAGEGRIVVAVRA